MKSIPKLHTDISGNGPPVVLLHGIFSSSRYWAKVRKLLEKDHRVIAIDLLGFGKSPKPRGVRYDYDEHIAAINQALEKHDVNEPFTLVGHSMGALIALRYSTLYESRLSQLVLTNMPVMIGANEVKREILGTSKLHRLGLGRGVHRVTWPVIYGLYKLRVLPSQLSKKIQENDYFFQHTAASRMGSFRNVIAEAKVVADFAKLRVRTVILSGLEDRSIYLENLVSRVSLGSNVRLVMIKTGHHIPCLYPELLARQLHTPKL